MAKRRRIIETNDHNDEEDRGATQRESLNDVTAGGPDTEHPGRSQGSRQDTGDVSLLVSRRHAFLQTLMRSKCVPESVAAGWVTALEETRNDALGRPYNASGGGGGGGGVCGGGEWILDQESRARAALDTMIASINLAHQTQPEGTKGLGHYFLSIRKFRCPTDGVIYVGILNLQNDDIAKAHSGLDPAQGAYLGRIIDSISRAETGVITEKESLDARLDLTAPNQDTSSQTTELKLKMDLATCETLKKKLVAQGYLVEVSPRDDETTVAKTTTTTRTIKRQTEEEAADGDDEDDANADGPKRGYQLGPRAFLEFDARLKDVACETNKTRWSGI